MRPQHHTNRDAEIAALAARQLGVVTASQLHVVGFGKGAIQRRLQAGRLHPVYRGVYFVGHPVPADGALEMAAVLACGAGAIVSHRSAGRLWPIPSLATWRTPVEVTVPGRDPGEKPGIRIHRVRRLDPRDVRIIRGIPVTSPARTLVDLAAVLPTEAVESAIAEARVRRLVRDADIANQLKRSRGRHGVPVLRQLLDRERGPALTRSEAERQFLALLRNAALPEPEVNTKLHGMEVDFLWRRQRVVVEVDGYAYHSGARAFERDRSRDGILVARGYAVIRVTWQQLVASPKSVIANLGAALAIRSKRDD